MARRAKQPKRTDTTDADIAKALRDLAGVDTNLRALPVVTRWRDQRDHLARLVGEAIRDGVNFAWTHRALAALEAVNNQPKEDR